MVRDQYPRLAELAGDAGLAREVQAIAPRVVELTELLVDRLGTPDVGASFPHRVTLHTTCHSLRLLHVGDRPRRLLEAVRGIDLVELADADECCGFGGTFAIKNADTSMAMLSDKLRADPRHAGRGLRGGGQLLPDAHRRRAAPPAGGRAHHAPGRGPGGHRMSATGFPAAARVALGNAQQRRNLGKATSTIRAKRAAVVGELPDWQALRDAGAAIKARAMATLPDQLERLEAAVTAAGGTVHWARDAAQANAIVAGIARAHDAREVIKVKSMATDEIGLNDALAADGIEAVETDLAELIVQLGHDRPSHILVPAIHRNRAEIRALFERTIAQGRTLSARARGAGRGRPCAPAHAVPHGEDGRERRELRRRRDRHRRRRRVRGQRPLLRHAARGPGHGHGHREGAPASGATWRSCCSSCRARRPASG